MGNSLTLNHALLFLISQEKKQKEQSKQNTITITCKGSNYSQPAFIWTLFIWIYATSTTTLGADFGPRTLLMFIGTWFPDLLSVSRLGCKVQATNVGRTQESTSFIRIWTEEDTRPAFLSSLVEEALEYAQAFYHCIQTQGTDYASDAALYKCQLFI